MTRSISDKIDRTVLFQSCHCQFLGSIKQPGLDNWKKSLLNDQYYIFFKFYKPRTTRSYNRELKVHTIMLIIQASLNSFQNSTIL